MYFAIRLRILISIKVFLSAITRMSVTHRGVWYWTVYILMSGEELRKAISVVIIVVISIWPN